MGMERWLTEMRLHDGLVDGLGVGKVSNIPVQYEEAPMATQISHTAAASASAAHHFEIL